jgi:hypothetical protein
MFDLYVYVDDVDGLHAELVGAAPTSCMRPPRWIRPAEIRVRDPHGYVLALASSPSDSTPGADACRSRRARPRGIPRVLPRRLHRRAAAPPGREDLEPRDVRTNWAEVISDVPDLRVDVRAAVQDGNRIWSEWRAYGTARSGAMLELRGVIIFGIEGDKVAWSRMYMEPVEQGLRSTTWRVWRRATWVGESP